MSIAVVVIVAGRPRHLARVVAALADQRLPADDVIVVDMGDARAVTDGHGPPVRRLPYAVAADGAIPLGAARNHGATAADADHLVFLDVDCIPHPALVGDYDDALRQRPDALACGVVRYLTEGWDDRLAAPTTALLDRRSAAHPARPAPTEPTIDETGHALFWSLNFAVTATTWRRLGGFDAEYRGYGGEDTDLAFRARRLGIPLHWLPRATAYHQWHPPTRQDPARASEIVANAIRFHHRWGVWPMRGWLDDLAAAGTVRFDPARSVLELVER